MQAAGGFAGTYQAGSSEEVKKFEAEMMAYTDYWWAGNVICHSLEQSFLTTASLQVCFSSLFLCAFLLVVLTIVLFVFWSRFCC
jgi:hypothetical protein